MVDINEQFSKARLLQKTYEEYIRKAFDSVTTIKTTLSEVIESQDTIVNAINRLSLERKDVLEKLTTDKAKAVQEFQNLLRSEEHKLEKEMSQRRDALIKENKDLEHALDTTKEAISKAQAEKERLLVAIASEVSVSRERYKKELESMKHLHQETLMELSRRYDEVKEQLVTAEAVLIQRQKDIAQSEKAFSQLRVLIQELSAKVG